MKIVVDTSAVIAVILDEPERQAIIDATMGHDLIAPQTVPWEVGNALSAMFKRRSLDLTQALAALDSFQKMVLEYTSVDLHRSVEIAAQLGTYAYDAYILECAARNNASLLTLDRPLIGHAAKLSVTIIEIIK